MGAIPTSDMPGYKQIHERACAALDRCQELQDIDFKESASWNILKWKIIRTALAMANLRDGGIIVVGASERDGKWTLAGISEPDLATYDVDIIRDQVNVYADPHVDIDIVTVTYQDQGNYLVLQMHEFYDTPVICKKDGTEMREGGIYVRPPGMARTTKVRNAVQLRDLLELAAEKHARRLLEVSRRIGLVPSESAIQRFNEELEGL